MLFRSHYARPDVTRLLFNNRPANRVEKLALPVDQEAEASSAPKAPDASLKVAALQAPQAAE